jgi:hypothetical protein
MKSNNDPVLWDLGRNWHFCRFCKHLHSLIDEPTCDAFPEGIPQAILSGKVIHNNPLPNQMNDIVLTPL